MDFSQFVAVTGFICLLGIGFIGIFCLSFNAIEKENNKPEKSKRHDFPEEKEFYGNIDRPRGYDYDGFPHG
jgi:hypothetical protein